MKTLKRYLSQFSSIGWYMSAGLDFREMMYLSKEYSKHLGWNEDIFPECFLLTDVIGEYYFEVKLGEILKGDAVLFKDDKTLVLAKNGAEFQRLEFPGYREGLVTADSFMGRVITADIEIESSVLGHLSTKLAYVITENTAFMFDFLLKEQIRIDYLIHVRYGMGQSNGMFVKTYLKELGTRYFISDWNDPSEEDYAVFETYKDKFEGKQDAELMDTGLFVPSYRWSWSGDVHWYRTLEYTNGKLVRFIDHNKALCFTGHKDFEEDYDQLSKRVSIAIEDEYKAGINTFIAGGARGFDTLAAKEVLKLRNEYKDIRLILALPFRDQPKKEGDWSCEEIKLFYENLKAADDVIYVNEIDPKAKYHARDRYMVDHSCKVISYLRRQHSGTGYTVNYAKRKNRKIIFL